MRFKRGRDGEYIVDHEGRYAVDPDSVVDPSERSWFNVACSVAFAIVVLLIMFATMPFYLSVMCLIVGGATSLFLLNRPNN